MASIHKCMISVRSHFARDELWALTWKRSSFSSCNSKRARSILFMNRTGLIRSAIAWRRTVSVWTHTPEISQSQHTNTRTHYHKGVSMRQTTTALKVDGTKHQEETEDNNTGSIYAYHFTEGKKHIFDSKGLFPILVATCQLFIHRIKPQGNDSKHGAKFLVLKRWFAYLFNILGPCLKTHCNYGDN